MNQKDLIKWGLIAVGAYLVFKYIQDHGGLDGLFGATISAAGPHSSIASGSTVGAGAGSTVAAPGPTTQPTNQTQQIPVLDMAGLVVTPDVNDSLTGTVKINGVPIRLSIITGDGRIFDGSGSEVTAQLQGQGVDVVAIRTAFANAGAGLSGVGMFVGWNPAWTM